MCNSRIKDCGDGTYSIVSAVSGFAVTRMEDSYVLYPACCMDSQKFILEETGTAWKNRQVLSNSVKTYTSDGVYEWTFIPNTNDTVLNLTKEDNLKCDKFDPIYLMGERFKKNPITICKSNESKHICFQTSKYNHYNKIARNKYGVICKSENFLSNR